METIMHPVHPAYCFLKTVNWKDLWQNLKAKNHHLLPKNQNLIIYLRAYTDFEFFIRYFFPEYCKYSFSSMHREFFENEQEPDRRDRREVIAAPRGNAKTTFKVLFKVLHAIVYGYEKFILIMGHSTPEAKAKVRDILSELMQNPRLLQVYGALAPVRGQTQGQGRWGSDFFVSQNGVMVMAKSRGTQVRGIRHGAHRPTLIILDDVEAPDRVLNEEQRYKTQHWFEKDVLKLIETGGGTNIVMIGTCLHPESLLSQLLQSPGYQGQKYQSILSWSKHTDLWDEWKQIFTDLSNPAREQAAQDFFEKNKEAMLEGTQVLWPEGEPYEYLMRMRVNEGIASFNSEKQNDPHDPNRQVFDMTIARRFHMNRDAYGEIVSFEHADGKVIPASDMVDIVAFHDPALGEQLASDYAAIVVVAIDCHGYLYCLDAWLEKAKPDKQIQQAFQLKEKWQFERLYLEDNNFQSLLKMNYKDKQLEYLELPLRVIGVTQHQNKEKRISTLEPLISNGHLLFAENITPLLMTQLVLFPTSHDDGPDALHGAVAQLKRGRGSVELVRYGSVPY
jgi:predicted phage terminase large subunit-like protein